jgi:predicted RND superfamily exporter protein
MTDAEPPVSAALRPTLSAQIAAGLTDARWWVLAAGLAVAIVAIAGLMRLDIQHDYRLFIAGDDVELALTDRLAARSAGGRERLALIYRPASGAVFESTSMLQLAKLTDLASRFPNTATPESLVTAKKLVRLSDAPADAAPRDGWRVVPFIHPDGLFDPPGLARMRADAAVLPTIGGRLVARDGSSALVLLAVDLGRDPHVRQQRLAAVKAAVGEARVDIQGLRAGDEVRLVGAPLFDSALAEILVNDVRRLGPTALAIYFALLLLLFRSIGKALIVLVIVILASAAALGTMGWLGVTTTILAFSGLLLVATLAVAEALHVITGQALAVADGKDPLAATHYSLDANLWPIVTTSATTIVGETVLLFNSSPAVREMGIVMIIGAVFALFFTLTLVPALVPLTASRHKGLAALARNPFERLAEISGRHPRRILAIGLLVCAVVLPGIAMTRLHDTMAGWFSPHTEFRTGLELLDANFVAVDSFSVSTPVSTELRNAAAAWPQADPALADAARLDTRLAAVAGVRTVIGPASARAALERRIANAPAGTTSLTLPTPLADETASAAPVSPAMLEATGLATPSEAGKSSYLLRTIDAGTPSNAELLATVDGVRAILAAASPASEAGGLPIVFANLGESNIRSTVIGTVLTALSITLCMAVAFRSVRLALLSLIPNLVPVFLVYGAWGWFVGEINLAATTVLAVALGIVVDDTTHIFMKHDRLVRSGLDSASASQRTIVEVGPAILVTSIVLATGFLLLGQSDFALTAQQANMIGVTILVAVVFDLTVTPAMLALLDRRPAVRNAFSPSIEAH